MPVWRRQRVAGRTAPAGKLRTLLGDLLGRLVEGVGSGGLADLVAVELPLAELLAKLGRRGCGDRGPGRRRDRGALSQGRRAG
jgi:hypothetical protein